MKQRLLVARAPINRPRVLFLDEPTKGLDPYSAREIRGLIASLAREGTTVVLTTHYMEEADELCARVAFLSEGRLVALDEPRELKLRYGQRSASVLLRDRRELSVRLDDPADAERMREWIARGEDPRCPRRGVTRDPDDPGDARPSERACGPADLSGAVAVLWGDGGLGGSRVRAARLEALAARGLSKLPTPSGA